MKIVTLCENTVEASFGLKAIHGFSTYIEFENKKILYDVGQEDVFLSNAKQLNIDLSMCDNVIISHGHFDHAGGLNVLENKLGISDKLIINKNAFEKKIRKFGDNEVDIGISDKFENFEKYSKSIEADFMISDNIWIISNVEPSNVPEKELLIRGNDGNLELDRFKDEISLAFKTAKGLVIISGCSHCGINNILAKAISTTKINEIYMLIGGLHTAFADIETKKQIIKKLKNFNISKIITGHCTGNENIEILKKELVNTEIIMNYVGYKFEEEI